MHYVERRRVITERAYIDDDDEGLLDPSAAVAVAKRQGFEPVDDRATYNVHIDGPNGCVVSQLTGRPDKGAE